MLMLKRDQVIRISKISESLTFVLPKLVILHPLEVVNRVSETQLQVGKNCNQIALLLKG